MDIRKLQRAIVDGLEDVKAQHVVVFNTEHLSPLFERVIIASGTSNRQTKALAASVRDTVRARGLQVMRTEGEENGEWIIVDCGAAVVHIMQPAIREYYHLEEIWGGKPVKMKLGEYAADAAGQGFRRAAARRETAVSAALPGCREAAPAKAAAKKRARPSARPTPRERPPRHRAQGGGRASPRPARAWRARRRAAQPGSAASAVP